MSKILIGSRACLSKQEVPYNTGLQRTVFPARCASSSAAEPKRYKEDPMRVSATFSATILLLWACSAEAGTTFTIADAEKAGFKKDSQQLFQMVGAKDGWSGHWAGESVELYQYESAGDVDPSVFEPSVQDGNLSGWVDLCQHRNMLMLSKGNQACKELGKVSGR